ncbi:hypothetical protein CVS40_1118 [Lucilia cuprina]|nr:hypothetical protein CVS40_1118 [Lucilia cuprina]
MTNKKLQSKPLIGTVRSPPKVVIFVKFVSRELKADNVVDELTKVEFMMAKFHGQGSSNQLLLEYND